ncbi:Imm59 family immunity protein [Listeria floridensis]|uniref:Imm59 family immunity protein n=1 Tax=Listeria floridensis TaxID=1494962 RepID=UPI00267EFC87
MLQKDIKTLGYSSLCYSIFEGKDNNRQEYQVRIEKRKISLRYTYQGNGRRFRVKVNLVISGMHIESLHSYFK